MARNSLTCIMGFSVKFFFQQIYTDYANLAYFDKRSHLNLLLEQDTTDQVFYGPVYYLGVN
jgi:hypothetical protein